MKGGRCGRESGGWPGAHQGAEQQNHKAGDTPGAKPGSVAAVGSVKAGAPLRRHPAGLGLPPTPSSDRGHGRCGGLCQRVAAGLARWPCCSCSVSGEGSQGCAGRASLPPSSPSSRAGPVAAVVTQERGRTAPSPLPPSWRPQPGSLGRGAGGRARYPWLRTVSCQWLGEGV